MAQNSENDPRRRYYHEVRGVDLDAGVVDTGTTLVGAQHATIATSGRTALVVETNLVDLDGQPFGPPVRLTITDLDGNVLRSDLALEVDGDVPADLRSQVMAVWTGRQYVVVVPTTRGMAIAAVGEDGDVPCRATTVSLAGVCSLAPGGAGALLACWSGTPLGTLRAVRIDDQRGVLDREPLELGGAGSPVAVAFDGRRWVLVRANGSALMARLVGVDGQVLGETARLVGPIDAATIGCRPDTRACVVAYAIDGQLYRRALRADDVATLLAPGACAADADCPAGTCQDGLCCDCADACGTCSVDEGAPANGVCGPRVCDPGPCCEVVACGAGLDGVCEGAALADGTACTLDGLDGTCAAGACLLAVAASAPVCLAPPATPGCGCGVGGRPRGGTVGARVLVAALLAHRRRRA